MSLSRIILHGAIEDLSHALQQVKDLNYLDEYGYTPLIESVIIDDIEKVKLILQADVDINQKDTTKRTALQWAVANNNFAIAEMLIKKGADVNSYNMTSESVLVKPILRQQENFKKLLIDQGASLQFANDYINAKLLGHRYELIGSVDIVDVNGLFTEVDYEGFYLESSLELIRSSVIQFRHHFIAKHLYEWFSGLDSIIAALDNACGFVHYDNYLLDYRHYQNELMVSLQQDPLILPFSQEGHAFCVVKTGSLLSIIDRVKDEQNANHIPIYFVNRSARFQIEAIAPMLYQRQSIEGIKTWLKEELRLQQIGSVPMAAQRIGNCSWANTEAIIPVLYIMLQLSHADTSGMMQRIITDGLDLFYRWREWDRQRALYFFMKEFQHDDKARRASIAALLAGVVFQTCSADNEEDIERAKIILGLLKKYHYDYVFQSYLKFYVYNKLTPAGKNLQRLLEIYERDEG